MQLKLLNFYKFLSNFANKLVGAFIPLIIYNETKQLYISFLYLLAVYFIRLVTDCLFKKQIEKNPQIFLLLRIFTIVIMDIGILLLEHNVWLGVILSCFFVGLDETFKTMSNEIIYNYSSLGRNSKSLGITRVFEQLGMVASLIVGGYLLDISTGLVVAVSLCLYAISIIPLIMYYVRNKKSATFNKDAVSVAVVINKKKSQKDKATLGVCRKIILYYALLYFTFAAIDVFTTGYKLQYFVNLSSYSAIGFLSAVFCGLYGLGSYVAGVLNSKYDIMKIVQMSFLVSAVFCLLSGFYYENVVLAYISFGVIGFVCPFMSVFILQRLLNKTRIFGISNDGLFTRDMAGSANYVVIFGVGAICCATSSGTTLLSYFMIIAAFMIFAIWLLPFVEEHTRVIIVDYLQNNEITKNKFSEKVNRIQAIQGDNPTTNNKSIDSLNNTTEHQSDNKDENQQLDFNSLLDEKPKQKNKVNDSKSSISIKEDKKQDKKRNVNETGVTITKKQKELKTINKSPVKKQSLKKTTKVTKGK